MMKRIGGRSGDGEEPQPFQAPNRPPHKDGEIFEHVAGVEDFALAVKLYEAAINRWPGERIMLRQEARIVHDSHKPRLVKK
jgi:hypothetical protein